MKPLVQQAIRLLARREYTHVELRKKLDGLGTDDEIAVVLADLAARGLLSDRRAAAGYLRTHAERFGAAKLKHSLRSKGVDDDTIAAGFEDAGVDDELQRARNVWRRKFNAAPQDPREWARQARFLQSRGFSVDVIRCLLKERDPA